MLGTNNRLDTMPRRKYIIASVVAERVNDLGVDRSYLPEVVTPLDVAHGILRQSLVVVMIIMILAVEDDAFL